METCFPAGTRAPKVETKDMYVQSVRPYQLIYVAKPSKEISINLCELFVRVVLKVSELLRQTSLIEINSKLEKIN